jgi:hypothetical protein
MTNAEANTTEKATVAEQTATIAEQSAPVAPEKPSSKKGASPKRGAPKGQQAGKDGRGRRSPTTGNKAGKKATSKKNGVHGAKAVKQAKDASAPQGSKTAKVLDLLKRPGGATVKELMKATGWQPHSVRGFLSGAIGKKMALAVTSTKGEDGERRYAVKN